MRDTAEEGPARPFLFLHLGDQHLTVRDAQNYRDLHSIVAQIAGLPPGSADFIYLPGDIAENGAGDEYALMRAALDAHPLPPIHLIPGDHDRQWGTMEPFANFRNAVMGQAEFSEKRYYYAQEINGVFCLFLDMVSESSTDKRQGEPNFSLGEEQVAWLTAALRRHSGKTCAVFMHTYPADLRTEGERKLGELFFRNGVRLVEMGHTHYNELAHDGVTTYAAARSIGQNEDGSVGYAVCAIDGGEVSWRFRALDRTWPFVLITSPADRRLATKPPAGSQDRRVDVRAMVLSDLPAAECGCRVDGGPWQPMDATTVPGLYTLSVTLPADARTITVRAIDRRTRPLGEEFIDHDTIELREPVEPPPTRRHGSDDFRTVAWPAKGIRGDQLGPNRAGRRW